jgi:hypothetical protein
MIETEIKIVNTDIFKLPIFYNEEKVQLNENIIEDLELHDTIDTSGTPIYNYAFNPSSSFSQIMIPYLTKYYTTDTIYLKETQELLKTYENLDCENAVENYLPENDKPSYDNFLEMWKEIKLDTGFKEKYNYIDWPSFEYLNNSDMFLQFMSMYNMSSPIISLVVPIFILIIPFFIIKMKGLDITMNEYIEVLKVLAANHAIGRIFTHFNSVSNEQKIYLVISACFYIFSIYQNVMSCLRFHENMKKIHDYLSKVKRYIDYSLLNMNNLLKFTKNMTKYQLFNSEVERNIKILKDFRKTFCFCETYNINMNMVIEIGKVLKCFYQLYDNEEYNKAFEYSFGFNGYIEVIEELIKNINQQHMNMATFISKNNKNKFEKGYYAVLKGEKHVKNSISFEKNIIITGPNASGKTTILKTSLINIILSQQFGCGFYKSCYLKPYKYIHCYLNIPDTSGRDSLFQAEARRCKDILDIIKSSNPDDTHFCVFDELYSGTNPDEAVTSATAFMKYLAKYKNVNSILTTHFLKVCKKLDKNKRFENFHMETIVEKDTKNLKYTYTLEKGISEVKGGINVLREMNYPNDLLDTIKK